MAGIYLHIPFCKTRCIYCDFYSTTRSELITRYIHALCNELEMRKEYLKEEKIETVYFGGGYCSLHGQGLFPKHPHDADGANHNGEPSKAAEVCQK